MAYYTRGKPRFTPGLSGGHHLPSPEYAILTEASFLPVKAKESMQQAHDYRNAKYSLLGSCMEVETLCNEGRTAAFGCDRRHSCIGAWRGYFYKKDIYKKIIFGQSFGKGIKNLSF